VSLLYNKSRLLYAVLIMFTGTRPTGLGLKDGKLSSCPSTPNCVCSQGADVAHAIEPLAYTSSATEAMEKLRQVVGAIERTKIISQTEDYLYAEFSSKLMGFVDDVEFYVDAAKKVIQVRSASRLGQSDLGVNRKRIELIRTKLLEKGA
jgi:uncharacterized protein (DUF1499 family)